MNRAFPAPTGHDVKAQGIALGMRPIKPPSPERATPFAGLQAVAYVPPLQGGDSFLPCSQGVALGLHIMPRWGKECGD